MKSGSLIFKLFLFLMPLCLFGQEEEAVELTGMDSLYREDQFYLGFSYNLLTAMPDDIVSEGFAGGVELGFIRDFPLNDQRNIALGAGLGWSFNNYGHNLFLGEKSDGETSIFRALDEDFISYETNRLSMQSIDVPLQFRWRTSTMTTYKFWRIYAGLKASYVYYYRSNFVQAGNTVRQTSIPEFNRFQLGTTFSFGYGTFNFNFYYGLTPFFNGEAQLEGEEIGMRTFRVGLMFYLL